MRTTVIRRAAAVTALLLASGGLGFAAVPAGGGEVIVFDATVDPNPSQPGDEVAVRPATAEDNCPVEVFGPNAVGAAGGSGVELEWSLLDPPSTVIDSGTETVGIDGSWEVALTAPDPGTYQFVAACFDVLLQDVGVAGIPPLATYDEVVVVEGAGPEFDASLDQASGPPGDDIELTAVACAGSSGAAALLPVGSPPASPNAVDEDVLQQYDVVDGQFGGVVPVPATTAPGTYQVVVWCMDGSAVLDSAVLAYTVAAAGAEPVPASPTFTG